MIDVVIFDFDGTLSDPSHRRHFLQGKKKNWVAFNEGCIDDTPLPPFHMFKHLYMRTFDDCWIFSGREEAQRQNSLNWLVKHGIPEANIPDVNSRFLMRRPRDYRGDEIIKEEFLSELKGYYEKENVPYQILGVFDDRPKVVRMWREKCGLFVMDCHQTGEEF